MFSSDRNCLCKSSLVSKTCVTPEVARKARPGEARSRGCCKIIEVQVRCSERWDSGNRGGDSEAWSKCERCGFAHTQMGFCAGAEEEQRAAERRVY